MHYETQAVYVISVAAELAGMHPQTLRQYDRMGLVSPGRASGRGRRYSLLDIASLRNIQRLVGEGINLAGIKRIMELESEGFTLAYVTSAVESVGGKDDDSGIFISRMYFKKSLEPR